MSKVSVGLRGWRFDEDEIFTDEGLFKKLGEIPLDARQRLIRLVFLVEKPCDACRIQHGEDSLERAQQAAAVYGEPDGEVLLCDDHEADFIYWYQQAGGSDHRGEPEFADAFFGWFSDGGRAPDGFGAVEHVETDPEELPDPPDATDIQETLEANYERERIDLKQYADDTDTDRDREQVAPEELDDLDTEYPTADE